MSDSRRQGNIVLISVAILVLFAISNLMADPAAGAVALSDLSVGKDDGAWEFVLALNSQ